MLGYSDNNELNIDASPLPAPCSTDDIGIQTRLAYFEMLQHQLDHQRQNKEFYLH